MNMKVFAVIKREYLTRVKTKGFIIGTFLFPMILILIFGGYFIFSTVFGPSTRTYHIIDQSGRIFDEFSRIQSDTLKNGDPEYQFIREDITAEGLEPIVDGLQNRVLNKEIDGYMIIPEDIVESKTITYSARNVSDFEEQESFGRTFSWIVTNMRFENRGLPADEIRQEMNRGRVRLNTRQVTEKGEIEKSGGASFALSYLLTYVIILMMMIYGQTLMRSVIEEKTQRITETIVSSIKPIELMLGKIAGICALGITQLIVFGGIILLMLNYSESIFKQLGVDAPDVLGFVRQIHFSSNVFAFMIIFFLLGFVFFSSIFAAVGAMVNTEDEGQQYQMPLMILIWIGFFIMLTVAKNPETPRAFWVSLFPLFTPIVMFSRIAVSDPIIPSGAYLSLFTMSASTVLLIMLVAKIYRVGILMYGKKASIKEAIRWIRYK